ncbi:MULTISPECIES: glycosyltransferase [Pseudomonas]|jgi:hypothetical protein|uniref:Glycosyltransferase n=1 Tax=Pseudomonas urmiensis TaxID=2745493 RepID=A0A923G0T9_9PSED|nr:glycosyltransferase [Pseudomonas urmiensis]MBV4535148.1 glycosyltransferase [Pseudomonas urmiensis]
MIEIATGSPADVTVVLLGHDQADHRARALHYYAQAGIACHALEPLLSTCTGAVCKARLELVVAQLDTPLVSLALDADFILPAALAGAAKALSAQPQAVAAQGYALVYAAGKGQVAYHRRGSAFAAGQVCGTRARLQQYAQAGQQAWRALLRVPVLQAALASVPDELDFAGFRVALSCAILAQGAVAHLEQTDVVCEFSPCTLTAAAREERLAQTVRVLRQWDAQQQAACADDTGFAVLNQFVRGTYDQGEADLLFTSRWTSVIDDPERDFEPRQYVELPYYNAPLFTRLSAIEFLCHAWPTGLAQHKALEGVWVRQRELVQTHPNDTPESLQERYWQALALGLFNPQICQLLQPMLDADSARAREMADWLGRLEQVPGVNPQQWLQATASGQALAAIAAATPDEAGRQRVLAHLARNPGATIAFVVVDLKNDDAALQATFDSLLASGIRNFKLVVLKAGKPPAITTARDTLHFIQVSESNWVTHLNQAVRQLPSEWLLLMQAGEVLLAGGLLRLLVELGEAPACHAIVADEVQRDEPGRLLTVRRPGSDLDLLRSQPGLMSRHWLVRREAVLELGGYSEEQREALEYDLLLRLVEAHGTGVLAHMDEYLLIAAQAPQALTAQARGILGRHLGNLGYRAQVSEQDGSGLVIDFRHSATPLVSILVASQPGSSQLQACLTGILQRTRYPRYEVVVAVASETGGESVQASGNRVRVVGGPAQATAEQLLNLAASHAQGEFLVVLSEHSQVISPAWIEGLLNEAQRPEVGLVGARLLAQDGTLVHAGYELLAHAQVYSPWQGLLGTEVQDNPWVQSVRSCAAVSAQCLMIRKELFEQCEGLQSGPDAAIELSLKVRDAGLIVLGTPRSQLLVSSGRGEQGEQAPELAQRWPGSFTGRSRFASVAPVADAPEWLAQLG